jgi:hypothetical protein
MRLAEKLDWKVLTMWHCVIIPGKLNIIGYVQVTVYTEMDH